MYKPVACHCSINKEIQKKKRIVQITNAEKKQSESGKSSSSYVVYTISNTVEDGKAARRRYSEFEAFRTSLVKLYPVLLIPPIPEKHSFSDYTTQKQKDDAYIIDKRKRMLERFLNRILSHPILSQEHVFHRFIDGTNTWSDILHSAPLLNLPRDPLLQADNSITASITNNLPMTNTQHPNPNSIIPIPSSSYTLKYPDNEFDESESRVSKTSQQTTLQFERSQKRIIRRLTDLSNDLSELGSAYNALSLNETIPVSTSIEKLGQIIDGSCTTTKDMVKSLEIEFSEYVQDYTQYIYIAKQVLRYRHLKQCQLELIDDTIQAKKSQLRNLVKTEDELSKLKISLNNDNPPVQAKPGFHSNVNNDVASDDSNIDTESIEDGFTDIIKSNSEERGEEEEEGDQKEPAIDYPTSASAPILRASKNQTKKWSSPRKLLSAVTYTLQGMIDTDPEQTRKNQINKLKDAIEQLEQARITAREDLKDMSTTIKQEFERLQVQKDAEVKTILISFAKIHLQYCEQNAATWKDIRNEVSVSMDNIK